MGQLYFIRHGQASFNKADYDQLSDKGRQQASLLGTFFENRQIQFGKVYAGTLRRQIDTAQICLEAAASPHNILKLEGLNEHHGPSIVSAYYPERFKIDGIIPPEQLETYRRDFYKTYFDLAELWVKDELDQTKLSHVEPWSVFKERFNTAVRQIISDADKGEKIAIFTSGGPVGTALGMSLGLPDTEIVKLAWQVRNTSVSEFLFNRDKFSLVNYNVTAHITDPELLTLV